MTRFVVGAVEWVDDYEAARRNNGSKCALHNTEFITVSTLSELIKRVVQIPFKLKAHLSVP